MSSSPELFRHYGASVLDWTGINSPGICKCRPRLNYSATLGPLSVTEQEFNSPGICKCRPRLNYSATMEPLSATEQELTHLGFANVDLAWTIPPLWILSPRLNRKTNSPGICQCRPLLNYSATMEPLSATEQELTHLWFANVILAWTIPPLWILSPQLNRN
jgi:hypothetical protein